MPSAATFTTDQDQDLITTLRSWSESPPGTLDISDNRRIQVATLALGSIDALTTQVGDLTQRLAAQEQLTKRARADVTVYSNTLHSIRALTDALLPER